MMADDLESEKDKLGDNWLSSWEAQSLDEWDRNSNMDELVHAENEQSLQKLWLSFQNSASAIAQLYKGNVICYVWHILIYLSR